MSELGKPNSTPYPVEFQSTTVILTESIDQTELNRRGLYVVEGLSTELAEQLVESSKEPHITEYCPNDYTRRFKSVDSVIAWQSMGRLALPLVKNVGQSAIKLVGFGWMGPGKPSDDEPAVEDAKTTFAIRIYKEAVGQGNALPYTKAMLDLHENLYGNEGVWLEAWGDNTSALRTYERAGFKRVAETPGLRRGEKVPRIYMMLGNIAMHY